MSSTGTHIAIEGMAANFGARSTFEPQPRKLPVKDAASKSGLDNTQLDPVQTEASFKTYGSNNGRIAIVVKNKKTGEVTSEYPPVRW
jgi:phage-related protein